MTAESPAGWARAYALDKPGAWPDTPFGDGVVAKVGAKIFCYTGDRFVSVKAASTREEADEWITRYPHDASPMRYSGRYGWNTLTVGGNIPDEEIRAAIDDSYDAIVRKLPASRRPPH